MDYATIAYSGAGAPLWTNRYNEQANGYYEQATAVAVDGSGNVVVTGFSFGGGSHYDYATIAYSGAGVPLWTNRYNGPENGADLPLTESSLAIGSDGAVYVTGWSDDDYATIKSAIVPPNHAPVAAFTAFPLFDLWPGATNLFILPPNDAMAALVFDGSQSSDADNDPLQLSWYADGQPDAVATEAVARIRFVSGPHAVTLVVSDGQHTATARISFEVITAAEAVEGLLAAVVAAGEQPKPLAASLRAALKSLDNGHGVPALQHLEAFQEKVRAQVARQNPALAHALRQAARDIIEALSIQ